jgi:hypothetical protein
LVKPDLLTKSGRTLKFRAMDDTLVLKDASPEVRLFRLHDNTQAPYLIAAYVPCDNLLVEGDLIDMGWIQHPWAENFRKNLAMRKIRFAKDIGPRPHRDLRGGNGRPRQEWSARPSNLASGWAYQLPCFTRLCFARKSRISA